MAGILKLITGAAEIAAGVVLEVLPGGQGLGALLIGAGIGTVIGGIGSMIQGDPLKGFATTTRNPIAPWRVCYGRVRTGGTIVYLHTWGDQDQMLDMVVVLAAHPCQSVDYLLLDQQRVQIDTTAIPTSASAGYTIPTPAAGSGTSFTPAQQKVAIASIVRDGSVVTVTLNSNMPALLVGGQVEITDVPGDLTLNGVFQVAEILNQIFGNPGSITFTYLSGGSPANVTNAGHVHSRYPDYGRNIYVEYLLGGQALGDTFVGMTAGTPWQGTGKLCTPASPQHAGGTPMPNPWTAYCSLQGKTAAFIRIRYDQKYFPSGLPQISFLLHGKNDIYDSRTSSYGYHENAALCIADLLSNTTWGFKAPYGTEIFTTELNAAANACDQAVTLATGALPGYNYTITSAGTAVHGTVDNYAGSFSYWPVWPPGPGNTDPTVVSLAVAATMGYVTGSTTMVPATEPRYACNGQFELTMRRGEILQNLLTSCAGRVTYVGGMFAIHPGVWEGASPAAVDLTQMAAGPFRWRPKSSIRDLYNGVKGTFISPENKWQSADFPYYAQDGMHGYSGPSQYGGDINMGDDGGERRWLELHLPFTISAATAQRIAKIELLRRRHCGTGMFNLNMAGYQFAPLDVIAATVAFLGFSGKLLEVEATRFRMDEHDGGVSLGTEIDVQETDSSVYTWSVEEELSPQGYVQAHYPQGQVTPVTCWPWSPGYVAPLTGDAVYPQGAAGPGSFGIQPVYAHDAQGNATAALQIKGTPPINALDTEIAKPQISCVASTTGGSLAPGTYVVGLTGFDTGSSDHSNTDYLALGIVTVAGSGSGSITVNILWGSGDDGGDLYVAQWNAAGYVFHRNQTVSPGAASVTITAFDQSTPGGPDPLFDHFGVSWLQEIHGGPWAQQVQAVTSTTITIAGAGMTANRWAGYVLSLLAKYDSTVEVPIINMPIASNTASDGNGMFVVTIGNNSAGHHLPDLTTLLAVGDLLVLRHKATFTSKTFSDAGIANPYYPNGATGPEAGRVAVVLSGADAGDVQTITGVSQDGNGKYTIFNLAAPWKITPTTGDLVVVCAPANAPECRSAPMSTPNNGMSGIMAQVNVQNLAWQTWLFLVRTEDSKGVSGPDSLAPKRELFLFGAGEQSRYVTGVSSDTQRLDDSVVVVDTSGGDVTFSLLPGTLWRGRTLKVVKSSADTNVVHVVVSITDNFLGLTIGVTIVTIAGQGSSKVFQPSII